MKLSQPELYAQFKALHEREGGFVMPNAWDAVSALLMKDAGFLGLGSSSAAIAFGLGRTDGAHNVSREEALANAQLMSGLSQLPVNGDLEDGYGPSPEDCELTVEAAIDAGLAGLGIEDTTADPERPIHTFDDAVARVAAAARVAKGRILLTGRTDNFLHDIEDLDDTVRRLVAFAEAGADVLYAPFLPDMDAIRTVVKAVAPKPVNVLIGPPGSGATVQEIQAAGVRRISLGAAPYVHVMASLRDGLAELAIGNITPIATGMWPSVISKMIRKATA